MVMNSGKKYRLEFLVEANTWSEVVKIFKADLDLDIENGEQKITKFQTNNIFLIHVSMNDSAISKEFYSKVAESGRIALV